MKMPFKDKTRVSEAEKKRKARIDASAFSFFIDLCSCSHIFSFLLSQVRERLIEKVFLVIPCDSKWKNLLTSIGLRRMSKHLAADVDR